MALASGAAVAAASAEPQQSEDLTTQLFNADGSLRDTAGVETEAKSRTVTWTWSKDDNPEAAALVHVDGSNTAATAGSGGATASTQVSLQYQVPDKWGRGTANDDDLYLDRRSSPPEPACRRITVYRAPGSVPADRLGKATKLGVAKALEVPDGTALRRELERADLIGGRSRKVPLDDGENQRYYEFDLALAPKTCDKTDKPQAATSSDSDDNLGLGFCPYESIYLLSATVLDDRLYVICVESDPRQWKRASADLRRVRSSFAVQRMAV